MSGTQGYGDNAKALAQEYESVTFAEVHREVLHLFPQAPSSVLDIGAGSGRDAAALVDLGHAVVAVEPTLALRQEGMRIHAGKPIVWIDDQLPHLARLSEPRQTFDLILLTAVWMHLDDAERFAGMRSVANLLSTAGRLSLSLRHGPVPHGRRMFDVTAEETIALANAFGLQTIYVRKREDMLGRPEVEWSFIVLER